MKNVSVLKMPLLEEHKRQWKKCKKCSIGKRAYTHVFFRGSIPCTVLFIGEAPGKSEDVIGEPFVGVSGKLLDRWIKKAEIYERFAICNTVLCRPCDVDGGPNRAPSFGEVNNCQPRLTQFVRDLASPKWLVILGKVAMEATKSLRSVYPFVEVCHPAYAVRQGGINSEESKAAVRIIRRGASGVYDRES